MLKKVLHISKYYPPHAGGIEDVCYNIVHYLSSLDGIEQRVICFNDSSENVCEEHEGIKVFRVGFIKKVASQALSYSYGRELKSLLSTFKPDIIHFHAPNPFVAYYLLSSIPVNVKLIVHWHSDIIEQKFLYTFVRYWETKLLSRADIIIATSLNYIEGSKPLLPFRDKTIVVQNVINPAKFEYTDEVRKKAEEIKRQYQNKPIILFVGRHVAYKGLSYLLSAAQELKNSCEILIGGNGPLTDKLKKSNSASNIHYLGRISDDDLAAYYYAADIFAFPSITKNEAFGVVLAEAMYCETPAVTFTIEGSGVNFVNLDGVTGIEVKNKDYKQFAAAIDRLLVDDSLLKNYALQAKKRVKELFVMECIQEKLRKLYLDD